MLKKRDGQGLSVNIIIVAVIGLIILTVLVIVFNRESGESAGIFLSCEGRGGECKFDCGNDAVEQDVECGLAFSQEAEQDKQQICCVNITRLQQQR